VVAALAFAGTYTLWEQSLKIRAYPLNTFFAALILYLTLRWQATNDRRFLFSAFFLTAWGWPTTRFCWSSARRRWR
jgi:hypothetical protein